MPSLLVCVFVTQTQAEEQPSETFCYSFQRVTTDTELLMTGQMAVNHPSESLHQNVMIFLFYFFIVFDESSG